MKTLSLSEAKMKLSELIEKVQSTDLEVIITKNGRPAAVLANSEQNPPRLAAGMNAFLTPGGYKGER